MKKIILMTLTLLVLFGCRNELSSENEKTEEILPSISRSIYEHTPDFNGDGKADYILIKDRSCFVSIKPITGGSFEYGLATGYYKGHQGNKYKHYFGDVNGDGRDDMIQVGNRLSWIGLADVNGKIAIWTHTVSTGTFREPNPFVGNSTKYQHLFADVNGDERVDMIQIGDRLMWIGLADINGKFNLWTHTVNTGDYGHIYGHFLADTNGDGRKDLIQRGERLMWIGLADINGKFNIWTHMVNTGRYGGNYDHEFADVNGDGREDMIQTRFSKKWIGLADISGNFKIWSY